MQWIDTPFLPSSSRTLVVDVGWTFSVRLLSHRIRSGANSPPSGKAPHLKIFARCCKSEKGDNHKEHRTCEPGRIVNQLICPENFLRENLEPLATHRNSISTLMLSVRSRKAFCLYTRAGGAPFHTTQTNAAEFPGGPSFALWVHATGGGWDASAQREQHDTAVLLTVL